MLAMVRPMTPNLRVDISRSLRRVVKRLAARAAGKVPLRTRARSSHVTIKQTHAEPRALNARQVIKIAWKY